MDARGTLDDPAELARKAEELGFDSFWLGEHPVIPAKCLTPSPMTPDGSIPEFLSHLFDPFVGLARASAVTSRIKLGTAVCLVPERNPLLLAKEVATLDYFSGGRMILGIGAGWLKEESEIMGVDFSHRWTQAREAVMAMKELWTKDPAEYHGRYYDFPGVRCFPKPIQRPNPPIVIGSRGERALRRVVRWADGWFPPGAVTPVEELRESRIHLDRLAEEAGRDPRSIEISAFRMADDLGDRSALEAAGLDRLIVALPIAEKGDAIADLESAAREVF